jgi:AcrR family transcriptional regulator
VQCVAEVGYARVTIREIARAAQMTSGSLYHYFPNKAELIDSTVAEMADVALPRIVKSAQRAEGVLDKLMAILDECEHIHRDYPYAAAFDRAIRSKNLTDLGLDQRRESSFTELRDLIVDIVEQGRRAGALATDIDVDSAANAIFTIIRGLNEYTTAASPEEYHGTVQALKALVRGALFDYRKLSRPRKSRRPTG